MRCRGNRVFAVPWWPDRPWPKVVMTPLCRMFALLTLLLLTGCEAGPGSDCTLTIVATMPLQVQDRLLVVPVGINGHWTHLIVDSGAERTTISSAVADRLGLPHDPRHQVRSMGVGGSTTTTH